MHRNKRRARPHALVTSHAGLQPCNLKVNQNSISLLSVLAAPSSSKAQVSILKMPTQWQMSCSTQSPTHARTCTRSTSSIFETWRGTRGLLLESTEAFYRTALRRGHCATQAHSGRSSLTPAYTPMGDNGKGGYILPKKKERENERKRRQRSGGIEAVSRSSVHQSRHPPSSSSLCLILLLLCYLGGYVKHARTHAHTININNGMYGPCKSPHRPLDFLFICFLSRDPWGEFADCNTHSSRFTPLAWERVERLYVISTLCW